MSHITQEQKEIMINYMKNNSKLNVGKFSPDFTRVQARALWQELANILNSHANGAKKEWSAWRKVNYKIWLNIHFMKMLILN